MEIEKFHNTLIAFDTTKGMANATDMLKAYPNKRMADFLRLKSTKEFISILESDTGIPVFSVHQGAQGGTWMSKWLAYEFAAWLDPKFKLFVYQVFDKAMNERLRVQQAQIDYFWSREDIKDLYGRK